MVRMVTIPTTDVAKSLQGPLPIRLLLPPPLLRGTAQLADSPPATDTAGLESLKCRQAIWVTNCFDLLQGLCPLIETVFLIVATYALEYETTDHLLGLCTRKEVGMPSR